MLFAILFPDFLLGELPPLPRLRLFLLLLGRVVLVLLVGPTPRTRRLSTRRGFPDRLGSALVVLPFSICAGKNLVSLIDLLELVLVALGDVGVVLLGQFLESLLYLYGRGSGR